METSTKIPKSKAKTAYGLLSEVRTLILAEPLRYNQHDWLSRKEDHGDLRIRFPACGTVGCVAGWVATLKAGRKFSWMDSDVIAAPLLGLSEFQAHELFRASAADGSPQTIQHAKSGAKHIAAFQKKYRTQLLAKKVTA